MVAHSIAGPIAFGGDPFCKLDAMDVLDVVGIVRCSWEFVGRDERSDRDACVGRGAFAGWLDYTVKNFYHFTEKVGMDMGKLRRWSSIFFEGNLSLQLILKGSTFCNSWGEWVSKFVNRCCCVLQKRVVW